MMRSAVQSKMFEIIKQKSTSQDVSSFCRDHNIAKASYYYWLKKFRDRATSENDVGFMPINISGSSGSPLASVQLNTGVLITIYHQDAFSFVQNILQH